MARTGKKSLPRKAPAEAIAEEGFSGASPPEASHYIRFALAQLASENGHHKFEQLCFNLSKKRIYPNIIPSTGPVSAGGDQGADFESYKIGKHAGADSPFFALATEEKVLFACSIQQNLSRKIKEDLKAASEFHQKVDRVVFFCNSDVPSGRKHSLQAFASHTYGLALEIFDARAISELLVEHEVFWIANTFLSIPNDFMLASPKGSEDWYVSTLGMKIGADHLVSSDFFKIKNAVRFATFDHEHQSDLPQLLRQLRMFRQHPSVKLQRRAFYEEFVASLRGLGVVQGFEPDLESYFEAVRIIEDIGELEDAAVLISYSVGAASRGLLQVEIPIILTWKRLVADRVEELLGDIHLTPSRRSSLLFTKGFLALFDWIEFSQDASSFEKQRSAASSRAVGIWRKMIKEVHRAPMFPLERFGRLLSEMTGGIGEVDGFPKLSQETDILLAKRFGTQKLAEQAFDRSKSCLKAGLNLDAIDHLHQARDYAFTEETTRDSVQFCLFLSHLYSEAHLFCAAKCYALGAAFAALKMDDDSVRGLASRGLGEAASNDHANGASLLFFLSVKAFVFVSGEFSITGSQKIRQSEWARIDFYSIVLARLASLFDASLYAFLRERVLTPLGATEIYDDSSFELDRFFADRGIDGIFEHAVKEGIMPPFSDLGERRRIRWEQFGIRWLVDWPNTFEATKVGESFCAALQILLLDLRNVELSILPGEVCLNVEVHDDELKIEEIPDNSRVRWRIFLPRKSEIGEQEFIAQAVGASVLKMVSALSHGEFKDIYENRLRKGLNAKLFPYAPYTGLFEQFYSPEDFAEIYESGLRSVLHVPDTFIKTDDGLDCPCDLHPRYSRRESERLIQRRYEVIPGKLKLTLPRLAREQSFVETVKALRQKGWKDWHILSAATSIKENFVAHEKTSPGAGLEEYMSTYKVYASRDEEPSDPAPPASLFTAQEMERALRVLQISILKALGFDCWQKTPNFEGIDRFLRRFNYWSDDVPHPSILPE